MYVAVEFQEDAIKKSDQEPEVKTFQDLKLKEKHVEEFLRMNSSTVFGDEETLLIIGQQVKNSQNGISDLTAIDADGNIVLIEIKRDEADIKGRKEPFEFQAIRYAASYAKIKSPDELVDLVYAPYIEHRKSEYDLAELTTSELANRLLTKFLEENNAIKTFNSKQRIILVASSFDAQTLSAVAWLASNDVDISCFTITPVQLGDRSFLDVEKILPPQNLDEFYVDLSSVSSSVQSTALPKTNIKRRALPRMPKLFEWGVLKPGDKVRIKNFDDSEAVVKDTNNVSFKGKVLSFNQWAQQITTWSSVNIYEWTVLAESGKTLYELREEKMQEMEQAD